MGSKPRSKNRESGTNGEKIIEEAVVVSERLITISSITILRRCGVGKA